MINLQIHSVQHIIAGATNKNVNSIGSVIPVKNDVNAADS